MLATFYYTTQPKKYYIVLNIAVLFILIKEYAPAAKHRKRLFVTQNK